MEAYVDKFVFWASLYGTRIIAALAIFVIGKLVAGWITKIVTKTMKKRSVDETLTKFVANFTKFALLTFVILAAISALGVQTTSFIAVLGAAGLAVGFALQGSLSNFASGVMLIMFRPFKAGDYVEAGGTAGVIEEVQIFNTIMKTPDNRKVIVPNSKVTGDNVINYSAKDMRRIDLVFGIGYSDDIKKAKNVLAKILSEDERVLKDPEPTVGVLELGDSSVNFAVRPWVKTADYWNVYFDVTEKVKLTFDKEGISIPFPQSDIHVYSENGMSVSKGLKANEKEVTQ